MYAHPYIHIRTLCSTKSGSRASEAGLFELRVRTFGAFLPHPTPFIDRNRKTRFSFPLRKFEPSSVVSFSVFRFRFRLFSTHSKQTLISCWWCDCEEKKLRLFWIEDIWTGLQRKIHFCSQWLKFDLSGFCWSFNVRPVYWINKVRIS